MLAVGIFIVPLLILKSAPSIFAMSALSINIWVGLYLLNAWVASYIKPHTTHQRAYKIAWWSPNTQIKIMNAMSSHDDFRNEYNFFILSRSYDFIVLLSTTSSPGFGSDCWWSTNIFHSPSVSTIRSVRDWYDFVWHRIFYKRLIVHPETLYDSAIWLPAILHQFSGSSHHAPLWKSILNPVISGVEIRHRKK